MNDALVEVLPLSREHRMIVVVVGRLGGGRRRQLHGFIEDIGQVECARRQSGLAGTSLGSLWRTGEAMLGGGRGTVECFVTSVQQWRRIWQTKPFL